LGGGSSYTDDTAAQYSQQNMGDKMQLKKQRKDLEREKPKPTISMDPDKLSDFEKRQEILRAKIAARQNRGK
jgi:hypothetical protein